MNILLTFFVGAVGGMTFYHLKLPGGMMIGAVIASVCLSLLTPLAEMPTTAKMIAQIVAGTFLGCSVSRESFSQLRKSHKLIYVAIGSFLILNLLLGLFLTKFTSMDLLTALLATVPGGVSDVSLAAADMNADVASVVTLQFIRLCAGIGVFPLGIAALERKQTPRAQTPCAPKEQTPGANRRSSLQSNGFTLAIGAAFGLIGHFLNIPSGPLLLSMVGTLAFRFWGYPLQLSRSVRRCAQILSGTYIGCSIPNDFPIKLPQLVFPALCIVSVYMLNALLTSHVLTRLFPISRKEAMLILTPAGASDMALISADLGVESPSLIAVHIARLIVAAGVLPQLWYAVSQFAGS